MNNYNPGNLIVTNSNPGRMTIQPEWAMNNPMPAKLVKRKSIRYEKLRDAAGNFFYSPVFDGYSEQEIQGIMPQLKSEFIDPISGQKFRGVTNYSEWREYAATAPKKPVPAVPAPPVTTPYYASSTPRKSKISVSYDSPVMKEGGKFSPIYVDSPPTLVPEYNTGGSYPMMANYGQQNTPGMSSAMYPGYLGFPTAEFPQNKVNYDPQPTQNSQPNVNWGSMVNAGVDAANATMGVVNTAMGVMNYFDQQRKKREQEEKTREMGMTDNLMENQIRSSSRGDYSVTGSSYGMFRPDQYRTFEEGGDIINIDEVMSKGMPAPEMLPAMPVTGPVMNNLSGSAVRDYIAMKESSGNYMALPKKKDGTLASSAVGKYQFLWEKHKDWITKVTGVRSKEEFRRNPEAQEKAFDYWDATVLTPEAMKIKSRFPHLSLDQIKTKIHFAGPKGAWDYFTKGKETKDAFGTTTSSYQVGGEYDMTEEEITAFMAAGGEVEFLD